MVAAAARVIQLLLVTETETGFIKTDKTSQITAFITYAIIILCAGATVFASTYFVNRQPISAPNPKNCPALPIISNILAVYCLYGSAKYILSESTTVNLVLSVIFLINGIYFILYAISGITKINLPAFLSLSPIILVVAKTLITFFGYNGMAVISENVFEILFLCANCLFFLNFSKVVFGAEIRKSGRRVLLFGNVSFLLSVISAVSPLFVRAIGKDAVLHSRAAEQSENILFGVFALIFAIALYSKKNIKTEKFIPPERLKSDDFVGDDTFYYENKQNNK